MFCEIRTKNFCEIRIKDWGKISTERLLKFYQNRTRRVYDADDADDAPFWRSLKKELDSREHIETKGRKYNKNKPKQKSPVQMSIKELKKAVRIKQRKQLYYDELNRRKFHDKENYIQMLLKKYKWLVDRERK